MVVGGAYAGLLAAHALAEHFERVTVCERDLIDEDTGFHPGVPQARHSHAAELAQRFQCRLECLIRLPWSMATSSDLSWDPAPPSRSAHLIRWYLQHLLDLIPTDPEAATRFLRVQNMISNPTTLVAPRMIAKVLRQSRTARAN